MCFPITSFCVWGDISVTHHVPGSSKWLPSTSSWLARNFSRARKFSGLPDESRSSASPLRAINHLPQNCSTDRLPTCTAWLHLMLVALWASTWAEMVVCGFSQFASDDQLAPGPIMLMLLDLLTFLVRHLERLGYKFSHWRVSTESSTSSTVHTIHQLAVYHPGVLWQPQMLETAIASTKELWRKHTIFVRLLVIFQQISPRLQPRPGLQ